MGKAQTSSKKSSISIIVLIVFIGITYLSASLPFIPSFEYLSFLKYIAFPIFCLFLFYRVYILKDKETGLPHYKKELKAEEGLKNKLKIVLFLPFAILFAPAVILALAQWYPAWPSQFIYSDEVKVIATVTRLGTARKVGRTKIYIKKENSNLEQNVHWPKEKSQHISVGSSLRLTGKKNWFGTYILSVDIIHR